MCVFWQTGVYTLDTPGGWHLLGATSDPLFNPTQDPPAMLRAGIPTPSSAAPSMPEFLSHSVCLCLGLVLFTLLCLLSSYSFQYY